jgi:hypothetical protein
VKILIPHAPGAVKRPVRVATALTRSEARALRHVRRYVAQMTGWDSDAEALRFLIRNWETP